MPARARWWRAGVRARVRCKLQEPRRPRHTGQPTTNAATWKRLNASIGSRLRNALRVSKASRAEALTPTPPGARACYLEYLQQVMELAVGVAHHDHGRTHVRHVGLLLQQLLRWGCEGKCGKREGA